MKPPWEWNEDDIRDLIANQVKESLTLEYKACDALAHTEANKREISKDVSAFANSAGGAIVYGVIEDKYVPTRLDVGYLPSDISKEWVEQVINGNIQRRIDGVRVNPVGLTGAGAGKVIYVIWVPQSSRAPHMAADHRFYKRFNFESAPMEEYEVRDVARRSEAPDLKLELRWDRPVATPNVVELQAFISNDAPEPATHVVIRLYLDARTTVLDSAGFGGPIDHSLTAEHGEVPVRVLSLNWSPPMKMPIWEGEAFRLTDTAVKLGLPPGYGRYIAGWRLTAPRMNPKQRYYSLLWDSDIRVVEHR